jgi:hypothetical protein
MISSSTSKVKYNQEIGMVKKIILFLFKTSVIFLTFVILFLVYIILTEHKFEDVNSLDIKNNQGRTSDLNTE